MDQEPQIITDENWDLDNSYHNDVVRKKLLKGSLDHLEELFEYDDLMVYHYRKQIFAIDNSRPTKQLVYWVKYSIDSDVNLGIKIVTQRAIWRDITQMSVSGLPAKVFF